MEDLFYSILNEQFNPQVMRTFLETLVVILVGVAAVVAVCISLWHVKEKRDDLVFTVTRGSIGEQSEKIKALLSEMKATKREVTNALLLLEEIVVRLHENTGEAVTARVRKVLGDVSLVLSARGEAYNPFAEMEWNGNSEDIWRDMIFYAHREELSYSRRNGRNIVIVRAHSAQSRAMYFTFGAMLLGCAVGFGMKWLPVGAATLIADGVFSTVQTLFMNALSLLIAPVVFFSITTSLSSLSGGNLGRIGGKVVATYLFTTVCAILIALGISQLLFSGNVPPLPESIVAVPENLQQPTEISVSALLIDIIPKNIVTPVANGAMLQVLFVSVFLGLALGALGERCAGLKSLFDEANALFTKMMGMVVFFMPLMAFVSFALLVFSSTAEVFLMLLSDVLGMCMGVIALFIVYALLVLVVGRKSSFPYLKKTAVYFLTPFALASSSACIPLTMDFCKKRLGVSEKIASFSIPLGATINMDGCCLSITIASVMLARMCGLELDGAMLAKIGLMVFMLSVGAPGVPGAHLVCMATVLVALGLPAGAIGFVIGIDQIIDRLTTGSNVNGDIAASVLVSASEHELDDGVYSA